MKKDILLVFTFFLLACSQSTNSESHGEFSIYLLEDSSLGASNAYAISLKNLDLSNEPFITSEDLNYYEWDTHSFKLKEPKRSEFENFILQQGSTRGVPFVVTVGKSRIYFGTFWWSYSSSLPPKCAVIYLISQLPYRISLVSGAQDKRNDNRIFNSLVASGVLI